MPYVVVLQDDNSVIGPFDTQVDAALYAATDLEENCAVLPFYPPARNWKRDAKKGGEQ